MYQILVRTLGLNFETFLFQIIVLFEAKYEFQWNNLVKYSEIYAGIIICGYD